MHGLGFGPLTYRAPTPDAERSDHVVHGPFPLRLGHFAGGLAILCVGVLLLVVALDDASLVCRGDSCTYRRSRLLNPRPFSFEKSKLGGVEVVIEKGSKNSEYGIPQLTIGGRTLRLKKVSVEEAKRFAGALESALERGDGEIALVLEGSRVVAIVAAAMLLFGLAMFLSSLRGLGRIRLELRSGVLHATRTLLGISLERWEADTHGVHDVEVAWSRDRTFLHRRHHPGDTAGAVVLRLQDGTARPVARAFRGFHLHRRAEVALRELLALPPRSAQRSAELQAEAEKFEPPPPLGGGWGANIAMVWIGVSCGSLIGLGLFGIVALSFGWARADDAISGWMMGVGAGGGAVLGVVVTILLVRRAKSR